MAVRVMFNKVRGRIGQQLRFRKFVTLTTWQ